MDIKLRKYTDFDVDLMKVWLNKPHVLKWFHDPEEWINELNNRNDEFSFIKHFIVQADEKDVGFCQFYDYKGGGETWRGAANIKRAYSIDYLIGEEDYLNQGIGTEMVRQITEKIFNETDAIMIIVKPDEDNVISKKTLLASGYEYNQEQDLFEKYKFPREDYIAYCGLDCSKCEAFIAMQNDDDELRNEVARKWSIWNNCTILAKDINCDGCKLKGQKTAFCDSLCEIRSCAMNEKLPHCGKCENINNCQKIKMIIENNKEAANNLKK